MTYAETGVFIALEGGEGAGKSTQAALLRDALVAEGRSVLLTHEPGATEVGVDIRRIVLSPETGELHPRTEALLYAADKAEHVERVVLPALAAGQVVVTDRYVDTSLAYQGTARGLVAGELESVLRWATGDLRPHLTIVLDVRPDHGLGRFSERDRIEGEPIAFHERARQGFLDLAAADPEHYLVLDARDDVGTIATAILERVRAL